MTTQAPTPIEALKLRLERACDCEPDILWECGPCKDITAIESLERALATSEAKLKEAEVLLQKWYRSIIGVAGQPIELSQQTDAWLQQHGGG